MRHDAILERSSLKTRRRRFDMPSSLDDIVTFILYLLKAAAYRSRERWRCTVIFFRFVVKKWFYFQVRIIAWKPNASCNLRNAAFRRIGFFLK